MSFSLTYQPFGAHVILISWPSIIDIDVRKDIQIFEAKILSKFPAHILETVVAYSSLTLFLHEDIAINGLISPLKNLYIAPGENQKKEYHIWKIPVCYEPSFGLDIEGLATEKDYTQPEVVTMHTAPLYEVYFIGFLPGFPYLGGLDSRLTTPRLEIPRISVPKGAVAIGGNQTGVYTSESPGGWHIIGNTPLSFFDVNAGSPCFLTAGDKLKFVPISEKDYHRIAALQKQNSYKIESEVYRD